MGRSFCILALLATASCSPLQYGPAQTVKIDGYPITVMKAQNRANMWSASHHTSEKVSLFPNDASIFRRNVQAIEAVSGCKVDPVTVDNVTRSTSAAVVC